MLLGQDKNVVILTKVSRHHLVFEKKIHEVSDTGGSSLSRNFWEHENQSGLLVIWLICIKLYRKKEKNWQKIWTKQESGLTAVWLKQDPPV